MVDVGMLFEGTIITSCMYMYMCRYLYMYAYMYINSSTTVVTSVMVVYCPTFAATVGRQSCVEVMYLYQVLEGVFTTSLQVIMSKAIHD